MGVRLLLADDHSVMRQALRKLLEAAPGLTVVGEAEDGREAVARTKKLRPDVVVIDITMPRMNGILAMRHILSACPDTKIIALSMHSDEQSVLQALKAGALGYVEKGADQSELVSAIQAVASGKSYLSPGIARTVIDACAGRGAAKRGEAGTSPLSPREEEVLQLLAEGRTSKEMALELNISVRTVDTHRKHIMEKLSVQSVAELVKWAIRHGLTSEEP